MIEYKIMTEDTGYDAIPIIEKQVVKYFSGFSIYKQTGYWEGKQEKSLCVIIIAEKSDKGCIMYIADAIRSALIQDSVLVIETKIKATFVKK